MEVNNNTVIKGDSDSSGLYEQNDYNETECHFENRIRSSTQKDNLLIENEFKQTPVIYKEPRILDANEVNDNWIPLDNENLLVNNQNLYHAKNNTIKMSTKYTKSNDEVNFIDDGFNSTPDLLSVTNNESYSNPRFWEETVPDIITNDKMYRDVVEKNINSQIKEPFMQDFQYENNVPLVGISPMNKFSKYKHNSNMGEPETAPNYKLNWTRRDDKMIHSGKSYNNYSTKYKSFKDTYNILDWDQNAGSINYYNRDWQNPFQTEFKLNNVKRVYTDPNGNTLDFDVCENRLNEPKNLYIYKL